VRCSWTGWCGAPPGVWAPRVDSRRPCDGATRSGKSVKAGVEEKCGGGTTHRRAGVLCGGAVRSEGKAALGFEWGGSSVGDEVRRAASGTYRAAERPWRARPGRKSGVIPGRVSRWGVARAGRKEGGG